MTNCEEEVDKNVEENLDSLEIAYLKNRIALMEKDNLNIKNLLKVAVALLDD